MFEKCTPEEAGISSSSVLSFLKFLQDNGLNMHSVLLYRNGKIFGEYYWKPFCKNFCHRMYSQTKSYVSIAIGLLVDDGKLKLDDKICDYFADKIDGEVHPFMKEQTISDMLKMTTCAQAPSWFYAGDKDRTHLYMNKSNIPRPSGSGWDYDSAGSQVLAALVERVSGKSLFDYLNEKIFSYLGTFKTAEILKTPNGDSWGDSALVCTPRDMLSFAELLLNNGSCNGKQLISADYIKTATSNLVSNAETGFGGYDEHGYGYQIWQTNVGGFRFSGMGAQHTLCLPEKNFIFVCTADNQGYNAASALIFAGLKEFIVSKLGTKLPENTIALNELTEYGDELELSTLNGKADSEYREKINCKQFVCGENNQGIKSFSFEFKNDTVIWHYENEQGKKSLQCGICKNIFTKFPQYGYSNEYGGAKTDDGFLYDCAASAAWLDYNRLGIRVLIIDKYFGNLFMVFSFKDEYCFVRMVKNAEAFLDEYNGSFLSKSE